MIKTDNGLMPLGDILNQAIPKPQRSKFEAAGKALKPLSRVQNRLLEPCPEHQSNICFQHSILCQTGLPYRDPSPKVRLWERRQGNVRLRIEAGAVPDPATGEYVDVSLPWGTKPRLILAHLNAEALRQNSPEVDIEGSLSGFVRRIRGFATGREIRMFKHQLASLSSATIRLSMFQGEHVLAINTHVITSFDLWLHKNERQRALWPSTVCLSKEYFESLQKHAVPLGEADLAALAHTAMGLDIYAWLAQRLHRIDPKKPTFIPWTALQAQFGPDYRRIDKFKAVFRIALAQVLSRYRTARLELDNRGMTTRNSPPPVAKRLFLLKS
ncbi:MAG: plasmid encoded RepA protein [Deltaproteobacteria bacterium]|nr:plasmid encoded RepA protein [Deltaproteobacteria bacterium]